MKKRFICAFICYLAMFIFCGGINVEAEQVNILKAPVASDIIYGEPLFESELVGGEASVEGEFFWEDGLVVFDAGEYVRKVIFTPFDSNYESVDLYVSIKVDKRKVEIKFEEDIYKHYDGTTFVKLPNYVVNGIIDDTVYVTGQLEGVLESALVGETNVILSGIEIAGDERDNYDLDLTGVRASVYRKEVEKFGPIKHRVDFKGETYVPADTLIFVDSLENSGLMIEGYEIKEVYDIYLKSDNERLDVSDLVKVKVKIEGSSLDYKRLVVFNYYNGAFEEVEYEYNDGYIVYMASSLGKLVIASRRLNLFGVYVVGGILLVSMGVWFGIRKYKKTEKINKYRSLKRREDYGDY